MQKSKQQKIIKVIDLSNQLSLNHINKVNSLNKVIAVNKETTLTLKILFFKLKKTKTKSQFITQN